MSLSLSVNLQTNIMCNMDALTANKAITFNIMLTNNFHCGQQYVYILMLCYNVNLLVFISFVLMDPLALPCCCYGIFIYE